MAVVQNTVSVIPSSAEISLYIGDLHQDVSENVLQGAFSEFSSIANVRICRDSSTGRSLGYGYINFLSQQEATRAIDEKNHFVLNGKAIRVTWCHRASDARKSGIGNVFVKNLCDSIDSMRLQKMFQNFGNVVSCKVATSDDKKSKGYGFIQFESENCANAAIEKLNGSIVGSKKMYAAKFVKKSDRVVPSSEAYTNLYVKNIDTDVSEESLQNKFSPYGKIVSLVIAKDENGTSRGFGFVNFENSDDAKRAAEALHGSQLGSEVLYVARAQKKSERAEMLRRQFEEKKEQILTYQFSNVYVKNIEDDVTEDELRHYFSQCGIITSAKLMRDDKGVSKGFGFVCFSTPEEANKAVNTFHGFILRYKPLYVAIAQRKEERKAQLQLQIQHAQHMAGFAGPSTAIHGGFSQFYYPGPGVVPHIPAPPGMMYPSLAFRPGWRANGFANPSRIAVQPSRVPMRVGHMYVPNRKPHGMKKGHPAGQPVKIAAGPVAEGSEMLTSMLSAAPLKKQKQILGENLHPLVFQIKPDLASKITGMLMEMDNSELLLLLDSPDSLAAKVDEAVEVLKFSNAKVANQDSYRSSYHSGGVAVN